MKEAVTHLKEELSDARAQSELELAMLQKRADADRDMLHAVVRDRSLLELLLSAEQMKCQSVERIITSLQTRIGYHLTLFNTLKEDLRSAMRCAYGSSVHSILAQVVRLIRTCDAVYHSDMDTSLGA